MARPVKKGLDYFSHDTDASTSREIEYLEATHGLTGYAIYLKILEKVYGHEGYYLPWTEIDRAIFAKRCNVEMETVDAIIETCLEVDLFSRWVYDANKVLTSASIQRRFMQATEKRTRGEINPEYIADKVVSASESTPKIERAGVSASETTSEMEITDVSASESTQRKGKERKVNKTSPANEKSFEAFWEKYPRKVGKADAKKAWAKIPDVGDVLGKVLAALDWQTVAPDWTKDGGKFIPHPSTYLNGRRWEDEKDKVAGALHVVGGSNGNFIGGYWVK